MNAQREQITFLDYKDYANVMTEWAYAINKYSTLYRATIICKKKHQNNYSLKHHFDIESIESASDKQQRIQKLIQLLISSNYIVLGDFTVRATNQHWNARNIFQSVMRVWFNYKLDLDKVKHVKFIMFHPGSDYRAKYKQFNVKRGFYKTLYAPDLYRLSLKTPDDGVIWPICSIASTYPEELLIRHIKRRFESDKLIIFHCPSNPDLKGTNSVSHITKSVISRFPKFDYIEVTNQPHNIIMRYRLSSTIHIDQFFPKIGTFGVSSIESLLMGNIVLSSDNNIIPDTHQNAMDFTPTFKAPVFKTELLRNRNKSPNTTTTTELDPTDQRPPVISTGINERLFKKALENICRKSNSELMEMCLSNLTWARTWLTPQYTVNRWEKILNPPNPSISSSPESNVSPSELNAGLSESNVGDSSEVNEGSSEINEGSSELNGSSSELNVVSSESNVGSSESNMDQDETNKLSTEGIIEIINEGNYDNWNID